MNYVGYWGCKCANQFSIGIAYQFQTYFDELPIAQSVTTIEEFTSIDIASPSVHMTNLYIQGAVVEVALTF